MVYLLNFVQNVDRFSWSGFGDCLYVEETRFPSFIPKLFSCIMEQES